MFASRDELSVSASSVFYQVKKKKKGEFLRHPTVAYDSEFGKKGKRIQGET